MMMSRVGLFLVIRVHWMTIVRAVWVAWRGKWLAIGGCMAQNELVRGWTILVWEGRVALREWVVVVRARGDALGVAPTTRGWPSSILRGARELLGILVGGVRTPRRLGGVAPGVRDIVAVGVHWTARWLATARDRSSVE